MSYTLQCKVSDEIAEKLRLQAGDQSLSELVRPLIEDFANGIVHLPDPLKEVERITPVTRNTDGGLSKATIAEMVRKNEAKLKDPLEPHVLRTSQTPFRLYPWDHDDHLRPCINCFRRPIEDRDACLAIFGKGPKALKH